MVITMVDKNGNMRAKDLLDINLDMSIVSDKKGYRIRLNNTYFFDEIFSTEEEAKHCFRSLVESRNNAEEEIGLYS